MNETMYMGNNETISRRAIIEENDGTFTAVRATRSRNFKTIAGALRWLNR